MKIIDACCSIFLRARDLGCKALTALPHKIYAVSNPAFSSIQNSRILQASHLCLSAIRSKIHFFHTEPKRTKQRSYEIGLRALHALDNADTFFQVLLLKNARKHLQEAWGYSEEIPLLIVKIDCALAFLSEENSEEFLNEAKGLATTVESQQVLVQYYLKKQDRLQAAVWEAKINPFAAYLILCKLQW